MYSGIKASAGIAVLFCCGECGFAFSAFLFLWRLKMVDKRESITAKLCAFARAWHSNKVRHKIYDDYLAYDIMGKEEYDEIQEMIPRVFGEIKPVLRSKSVQEMIEDYIAPIPLSRMLHQSRGRSLLLLHPHPDESEKSAGSSHPLHHGSV